MLLYASIGSSISHYGRDITAGDKSLRDNDELDFLKNGLQKDFIAPNTVMPDTLKQKIEIYNSTKTQKDKLI